MRRLLDVGNFCIKNTTIQQKVLKKKQFEASMEEIIPSSS
jgi:hypothetical protein